MKICIDLESRFQARLEGIPADFDQSELNQVWIVELCVQQDITPVDQARGEMDQSNF